MKCTVLHSSNNRIRVHMAGRKMSRRQADLLYGYLNRLDFVEKADVYDRTGDAVILFTGDVKNVKSALRNLCMKMWICQAFAGKRADKKHKSEYAGQAFQNVGE